MKIYIIFILVTIVTANYVESLLHRHVKGFNFAQFIFQMPRQYLPIPLQQFNLQQQLTITYGTFYHSHNAISYFLHSQTLPLITEELKEMIEATFSISIHPQSLIVLPQVASLYAHNPNQKFCLHHIHSVLRDLLPCGINSGLSTLIDLDTIFSTVNGMQVIWGQNGLQVKLIIKVSQKHEGIKRMKISELCGGELHLHKGIKMNDVIIDALLRVSDNSTMNGENDDKVRFLIKRTMMGNWYNPNKILKVLIRGNFTSINTIVLNQKLPLRAGFKDVLVEKRLTNRRTEKQKKFVLSKGDIVGTKSDKFQSITLTVSPQINVFQFTVSFILHNKMACFQNFEVSFGGGTELSSIPIFLISKQQQMISVLPPSTTLQTLQPDDSLPFQIITFSVASIGYLVLAIWKAYTQNFANIKQN